jgi:Cu(I)/Ag(I) efflux system membrane fusion protein
MKKKTISLITLAAILGGGAMWFAPHLLSAQTNRVSSASSKILYYTCPMHPSVKSDKPGNCPECGMKLQPVYADASSTNAAPLLPSCGGGCCGGGN